MLLLMLFGVFESLFLLLLLISKKTHTKADIFLGIIFCLFALNIGGAFIDVYNPNNDYPYLAFRNIGWLFLFLNGPALWFYIQSLTTENFKLKLIHLLHILPFALITFFQLKGFILLSAEEKIFLLENDRFKDGVFYQISIPFIGLSTISYHVWAWLYVRKHQEALKQRFAKIEDVDLEWLRLLSIASVIVFTVNGLLFNLDNIFRFANYQTLTIISYSFAAIYVLILGFYGLRQRDVFITQQSIKKNVEVQQALTTEKVQHVFVSKLLKYMEQHQPYLDSEINLSTLSTQLNVKPEFLSSIINSELDQNFFDFINKYRIEEFKIQVTRQENKHLSIIGVAYDCGFNSKAAFYRAFNKFEGMSPTAYISKVS